jgi:class 3 adenylate cyclase
MRCSKCGSDNREGRKFCTSCGTPFVAACPKCGAPIQVGERFCGECGTALGDGAAAAALDTKPVTAPAAGERRHLTVLFCDLVGSTQIAAHLDAEDWREIATQYQRMTAAVVTRFGGHVAKFLGDGLMVYFGWPEAHEDNAERAVRCGLAIIDELPALNERLGGEHKVKLSVRVGMQTGSVVMGEGGGKETDVFGDAPNIASRLQAAAEPDSVLITAAVHELVSGLFVVEDRGAQWLKGIEHPIQVYRVIRRTVARRRTHGAVTHVLTPFVGREDEMRLLLNRWERVGEGNGQLVLVVGEPGIGKSRLVEEFRARVRNEPHLWIECAGEQLFQGTPFHAVTQILNGGLGWHGNESPEERVLQLERFLELAGLKVGEALPLIAEMLNLPIPDTYSAVMFAPDQRRRRLLANLALWVLNTTRVQPVVIAIEDLHWVDPSTLELTQTLIEQAATSPLMLLYTARPEFHPTWSIRAHHAHMTLSRLNDRHTREMVAG